MAADERLSMRVPRKRLRVWDRDEAGVAVLGLATVEVLALIAVAAVPFVTREPSPPSRAAWGFSALAGLAHSRSASTRSSRVSSSRGGERAGPPGLEPSHFRP
jgi:hypothetical protein